MSRTFHHRFTLPAKCSIALFALLAFWLFWQRMPVVALVVVMVVVMMMERVLHSSYTLTADRLLIDRGRFARRREIRLSDIVRCTPMTGVFGLSHYLLIEHGAGRLTTVQPSEEAAFMQEIKKRQERL
ncbi:PH domain-containing protein [Prevotella sp. KH2C16]|uniref:PH domain-containing protein n=1 Tax=Prevotella sp. KH2C16 TaxID=1855325 RepID=UPI0008EB5AAF|nr:PH domain-containing protein [Prevotella sp. KH2C16]SFG40052.1 PH domain-containing protein [Prevotella sp. KH2C16]